MARPKAPDRFTLPAVAIILALAAAFFHGFMAEREAAGLAREASACAAAAHEKLRAAAASAEPEKNHSMFSRAIFFDPATLAVHPEKLRAEVLRQIEKRSIGFGESAFARLASVADAADPESFSAILDAAIDPEDRSSPIEKAMLYLIAVKKRKDAQMPFDAEARSFLDLASGIEAPAERAFLAKKFRELAGDAFETPDAGKAGAGTNAGTSPAASPESGSATAEAPPARAFGSSSATAEIRPAETPSKSPVTAEVRPIEAPSKSAGQAETRSTDGPSKSAGQARDGGNAISTNASALDDRDSILAAALREAVLTGARDAAVKCVDAQQGRAVITYGRAASGRFAAMTVDLEALAAAAGFAQRNAVFTAAPTGGAQVAIPSNAVSFAPGLFVVCAARQTGALIAEYALFYALCAAILLAVWIIRSRMNEAVRMNERMTEFVARVAHQIKTPLSAALLKLEVAENRLGLPEHAPARDAVREAHEQARSLATVFDNFTVMNRIFFDERPPEPAPLDLEQEVIDFFAAYRYQIESGAIVLRIDFDESYRALADRWALYNILSNLVSNSIKYCGCPAAEISISARAVPGFVVLSFGNAGAPIPAEYSSAVFEKFWRAPENKDDFRSSGLGLYIARALAEKMNGRLELDAAYSAGAKFDLYLERADK